MNRPARQRRGCRTNRADFTGPGLQLFRTTLPADLTAEPRIESLQKISVIDLDFSCLPSYSPLVVGQSIFVLINHHIT